MSKKTEASEETPTQNAVHEFFRKENGLLSGVDYVYNEDGSINWRKMVPDEFLYPNKGWFTTRKKDIPSSIEGLQDNQLLITLGGIKNVAKMRGFSSVSYDVSWPYEGYVAAKCRIHWKGNYETDQEPTEFEDCANATSENTDDFCRKFLETIACNRSFVRCVRNFLNINIVGVDEIDKSESAPSINSEENYDSSPITPSGVLEKVLREKKGIAGMDAFKEFLRELWKSEVYKNAKASEWSSFADIPAKEARTLLGIVNKK